MNKGSFANHALQNAFNNVYQGDLYYGDWDMFWSEHEEAEERAILRLISGGPVYISDAYGHTDPEVIRRMTGDEGKLLMCDDIGRPTLDCLTETAFGSAGDAQNGPDSSILKIYNRCGNSTVIASFSGDCPSRSILKPDDIPGLQGRKIRIYTTKTGELASSTSERPYRFEMKAHETIVLEIPAQAGDLSVIGLTEKYIPASGIKNISSSDDHVKISVYDGGVLAFASGKPVSGVFVEGKAAAFTEHEGIINIELKQNEREAVIVF